MDLEVACTGLARGKPPDPCLVVIFGTSGDLARTKLVPALYALNRQGLLPEPFAVIGFARREWDDEAFRREMRAAVTKNKAVGFGHDEGSARALDRQLLTVIISEEQLYRVDHYLGKETVQNMLVFRFANPGFEPIWNRDYIDHVQITVAENEGIGDAGRLLRHTGVVRDMVQNHLLQLLCITAMDPPSSYDGDSLTQRDVQGVPGGSVRSTPVRLRARPVRAGQSRPTGARLPGAGQCRRIDYADLRGAPPRARHWRWSGRAVLPPHGQVAADADGGNQHPLQADAAPDVPLEDPAGCSTIFLPSVSSPTRASPYLSGQAAGTGNLPAAGDDAFRYDAAFGIDQLPGAYEWLLLDAMQGDQTLFPRSDGIYRAWSIVDP